MRPGPSGLIVLLLALVASSASTSVAQERGEERAGDARPEPAPGERPQPPLAQPLAYGLDASRVRLVPLRRGDLPDLERGLELAPQGGEGVDPRRPPLLHWTPRGDLLAVRAGTVSAYTHYARGGDGRLRQAAVGEWPAGWALGGSDDVDGDGWDDLLLFRKAGEGYTPFLVRVAFGRERGGFALSAEPLRLLGDVWTASFTIRDLDGDHLADLVYHGQEHGAAHPFALHVLRGLGDGRFDPGRITLATQQAGVAVRPPLIEDFDRDGCLDLFLAPDDDVADEGQAHLARGLPDGSFTPPRPSIDLAPENEGWSSDRGAYDAQTCDVDLDGHADVIVRFTSWREDRFSERVYLGDGQGGFAPPRTLLEGTQPARYQPRLAWHQPPAVR